MGSKSVESNCPGALLLAYHSKRTRVAAWALQTRAVAACGEDVGCSAFVCEVVSFLPFADQPRFNEAHPLAAEIPREHRIVDEDAELDVACLGVVGEVGGADQREAVVDDHAFCVQVDGRAWHHGPGIVVDGRDGIAEGPVLLEELGDAEVR